MFDEEKEEWEKFFDAYKKKFGEEIGIMPAVFENDDFELDLVVGEASGEIRGMRLLQMVEVDEDEIDADNLEEIDEIPDREEEDGEDSDDEEDEDGDDQMIEVICYDLIAQENPVEIEGKPIFELTFGASSQEEGEEEENEDEKDEVGEKSGENEEEGEDLKIIIFSDNGQIDGEITGAILENVNNPEEKTYFIEDSVFEEN